ncbi:hemolytic protein HlpA [Spirochaetia bacterium]|nr:hemolytic protein HlpA [Spirochaetia bacterium]
MKMNKIPVVLIFYKRNIVFQVLEEIKKYRPDTMFLIADGGKTSEEKINCKNLRINVESKIDWPCEINKIYSEDNYGCRINIPNGLNGVFKKVDKAIILEDDCVPSVDFFRFCEEMLERYKNDERIYTVSGSNFLSDKKYFGDSSYLFSGYAETWGWATWRRCWEKYDPDMNDWSIESCKEILSNMFLNEKEVNYFCKIFQGVFNKTIDCDPWDYQWLYMSFKNKALSIVPNRNLITNNGFGNDATHTIDITPFINLPQKPMNWPINEPKEVLRNNKFDKSYGNMVFFGEPNIIKKVVKKIYRILKFNLLIFVKMFIV